MSHSSNFLIVIQGSSTYIWYIFIPDKMENKTKLIIENK